jgi:DNA-binding MarR family transcriptional regulator
LASLEQLHAALQLWDEYRWTTVTADMVSKHIHYLRNRGLIDWQRDRDSGKRVHRITQKGRKELADWACSSSIPASSFIFSFDLILNALEVLSSQQKQLVVMNRRKFLRESINEVESLLGEIPNQHKIRYILLSHHLEHLRAELLWLDELENNLSSQISSS